MTGAGYQLQHGVPGLLDKSPLQEHAAGPE